MNYLNDRTTGLEFINNNVGILWDARDKRIYKDSN